MTTEISTQTQPRGLALQSFADAKHFGDLVANSEFAPKDFRGKPASCMLAVQCGAEIGLAPLQALQSIAVVNGRPAVYGDAALAVVKASPICEYVTEAIDGDGEQMVATCTAKRRGYPTPTVVRFTVTDAKKAGLWGKQGPWSQYPKRMLQMRARGFALRDAFPDVLKGLVTAEEAQDYPTPEPTPLTKSVKAGDGIEVHHVASFEPPARKAPTNEPSAEQRCRLAIDRATTLDELDAIRRGIDIRRNDGTFNDATASALVALSLGQAERLGLTEEVSA